MLLSQYFHLYQKLSYIIRAFLQADNDQSLLLITD